MKIFGIGTDIVNIKRLKKTLKYNKNLFKKRVFSTIPTNVGLLLISVFPDILVYLALFYQHVSF